MQAVIWGLKDRYKTWVLGCAVKKLLKLNKKQERTSYIKQRYRLLCLLCLLSLLYVLCLLSVSIIIILWLLLHTSSSIIIHHSSFIIHHQSIINHWSSQSSVLVSLLSLISKNNKCKVKGLNIKVNCAIRRIKKIKKIVKKNRKKIFLWKKINF